MTPKSIISKLLQAKTTPTIFLPISCTSPFTVAMIILPLELLTLLGSFSASIKGNKWATDFFITRADLMTCGKNIFPAPNRSPTIFMPRIRICSMTSKGCSTVCRACSVSSITNSSMPCTSAYTKRSSTVNSRQAKVDLFEAISDFPDLKRSACSSNFSVASAFLLSTKFSTSSLRSASKSS